MAYLPKYMHKIKVSYTVPILGIGFLLYLASVPIDWPDPVWADAPIKIVTEIIVIISLMGAGLKVGMQYGWEHWKNPLRLIHTTMPFYMLAIFGLGKYVLELDGASALLLAAVCVPTDPVLAAELQLEKEEAKSDRNTGMRYLLTAEAGLNDGIAFPFVFLAILWSKAEGFAQIDFVEWTGYYFLYKIIGGIVIGGIIGYLYSLSIKKGGFGEKSIALSGFVGVALAFFSFGTAEVLNAYGFLSVFFTGLFAQYHRHLEGGDGDKQEILVFNEELEKFLIVVWTLLFGGFLASGILGHTGLNGALIALCMVIIIRPLSGRLAMIGTDFTEKKKWAIGFFGIKGVGSFFYLAFALYEGNFAADNELYAIISYMVLFSIIIQGLSGPRVVDYFKRNNSG